MNTQQLYQYGVHNLVEKILDFHLVLPSGHHVCFREIADKIELDLSVPQNFEKELLSPTELAGLQNKKDELSAEITELEEARRKMWDESTKLRNAGASEEELRMFRRNFISQFPWSASHPNYDLGDYIGGLKSQRDGYQEIIDNGGIINCPLLGMFDAANRKIYLFMENIRNAGFIRLRGNQVDNEPLIGTLVHELFHAWNFFASQGHGGLVREIEEPMVEFGTLLFLKELHSSIDGAADALSSDFEKIFRWKFNNVRNKRNSVGSMAAYGFGYHLYTLSQDSSDFVTEEVKTMLWMYGEKSGTLNPTDELAEQIIDKLNPFYSVDEEKEVYDLFYDIIMQNDFLHKGVLLNAKLCDNNSIVSEGKTIISGFSDWGVLHISCEGRTANLYVFKVVREDCLVHFRFFDENWNEVLKDYTITWFRYFKQAKNGNRLYIVANEDGKQNLIGLDMKTIFSV